jgi:hypothetical protein
MTCHPRLRVPRAWEVAVLRRDGTSHRDGRRPGRQVHRRRGDGAVRRCPGRSSACACRQRLMAARAMGLALEKLNEKLAPELDEPLRIRIGLHVGPAIVGDMGFARAVSRTAIAGIQSIPQAAWSPSPRISSLSYRRTSPSAPAWTPLPTRPPMRPFAVGARCSRSMPLVGLAICPMSPLASHAQASVGVRKSPIR